MAKAFIWLVQVNASDFATLFVGVSFIESKMSHSRKKITLEDKVPMSQSCLFEHEKRYFETLGMDAWRYAAPLALSSSTVTAHAYAKIVFYYLYDAIAQKKLKLKSPVYLLELGAGHGRFAYLFLNYFTHLLSLHHLNHIKFCYVMSDRVEKNVDYWDSHPKLQTYIKDGLLDFAHYSIASGEKIHLRNKGSALVSRSFKNPLIVIANSLFSRTASDFFRVDEKGLEEGLLTLETESENYIDNCIVDLKKINLDLSYKAVDDNYYSHPGLKGVLEKYKNTLQKSSFLMPVTLINAVDELNKLTKSKLFMLFGDKACNDELQLQGNHGVEISINHQQDFQTMVNFDALGKYVEAQGGDARVSSLLESYSVAMFLSSGALSQFPNVNLAYEEFMDYFSAVDQFNLTYHPVFQQKSTRESKPHNLNEIISLIKLSHYSSDVVLGLKPVIVKLIEEYKKTNQLMVLKKQRLSDILMRSLNNYYALPGNQLYCFELANMLYALEAFDDAIVCLTEQLLYTPKNIDVYYNMGLCYLGLGKAKEALQQFKLVKKQQDDYLNLKNLMAYAEKHKS